MLGFPTSPAEGDTYDSQGLHYKYRNGMWEQIINEFGTIRQEYAFKAVAGQTTISGRALNNKRLEFRYGYIDVFKNGIKQILNQDYTAYETNVIEFIRPLAEDDDVEVMAVSTYSSLDTVETDKIIEAMDVGNAMLGNLIWAMSQKVHGLRLIQG